MDLLLSGRTRKRGQVTLSLFYLVLVIAAVFFVMLALFLWEARNDELE